ncbi:hypothetical protein OG898_26075 [Streptomyces sp. NBC_00193]|uniref:hypothetical protein n=1 Tax=Streptomyces sp. NBC_00193 TaxID=2975675 RepID=UPI00224F1896|nr:hypothetical protein [Streptomyces sp. NBC_00193]MCX5299915.1 hypothetical protein [Streptomyces sp. NBC_00193]
MLGLTWLAILAVEIPQIPQHLQRFPLRHVHGTPPEAVRVPGSWRRPGQPEIAWYVGQEDRQGVTAVLRAHHPSTLLSYRPTAGWLRLSEATPGVGYPDQLPWLRDRGADVARLFRTEDRPVP